MQTLRMMVEVDITDEGDITAVKEAVLDALMVEDGVLRASAEVLP